MRTATPDIEKALANAKQLLSGLPVYESSLKGCAGFSKGTPVSQFDFDAPLRADSKRQGV